MILPFLILLLAILFVFFAMILFILFILKREEYTKSKRHVIHMKKKHLL